ncbi:MAG: hypothetical protein KDC13_06430 [Bacteroidetes bacterium]|nr:hypothetical protein [Bacteroidota bacterium]
MKLDLIKGNFPQHEAIELLSQLFEVKIKFHENKIDKSQNEEDIKMREQRIKQLQNSLDQIKKTVLSNSDKLRIESVISVN